MATNLRLHYAGSHNCRWLRAVGDADNGSGGGVFGFGCHQHSGEGWGWACDSSRLLWADMESMMVVIE